jgi:chorismate synthase
MLRWLTAGESHGPALVAMLEGLPAGVHVDSDDVRAALARRRLGYGRGARMKFEQDEVEFLGGLRHGVTMGSPVAIRIGNTEWPKWQTVMSPEPVSAEAFAASDDVNAEREVARNKPRSRPPPGGARPPTTRWSATRPVSSTGAPVAPGAPRVACQPETCSACGPR